MTLLQIMNNAILPSILNDRRLTSRAVLVYLDLYLEPMKSIRCLSKKFRLSKSSIARAMDQLMQTEWVYKANNKGPNGSNIYIPWMPVEIESTIADEIMKLRHDVTYVGEWIMKCWLDMMVLDKDIWDNARPSWLVTREGSGRLEFDRWYRSAEVAIEFQGPQHYRSGTAFTPTNAHLHRQMTHDDVKAGICHRHGITYIEISASELEYATIQEKLTGVLPLIPVKTSGPIFVTLSKLCRGYVNTVIRSEKESAQPETQEALS